jgi:hypothetical protein
MSIGPTTFAASLAATSLSQARGEAERVQQDTVAKERQIEGDRQAEDAAGVGTTDGDEAAGDRDADGRRLWEKPSTRKESSDGDEEQSAPIKDPTGQSGSLLDLTG